MLIAALLPTFGCVRYPTVPRGTLYGAGEWQVSERSAAGGLHADHDIVGTARRVVGEGDTRVVLQLSEAGCYQVVLGWASEESVQVYVSFGENAAGEDILLSGLGRTSIMEWTPSTGTTNFCVDHSGEATLRIVPFDESGRLDYYKTQYALVLGYRAESGAEQTARHASEAVTIAQENARVEQFQAQAARDEEQTQRECVVPYERCVRGESYDRPTTAPPNATCAEVQQYCVAGRP